MDIQISGRNVKITDELESYARKKVDRLDRYLPNLRDIRIDLARQHNSKGDNMSIAQITVKHERGAILRSEEKTTADLTQAIDTAVDKMYRQIRRFKGKRIDKRRRARFHATVEELTAAEPLPIDDTMDTVAEELPDEVADPVVRRKQVNMIPMDEQEAIEQMELLGHSFFMFYNADTGAVNVLYRRADEGYGLLVPTE
ncbi:MAG: ribosome-associated translation inhibitor RaiA [Chloroflexota bacterium]